MRYQRVQLVLFIHKNVCLTDTLDNANGPSRAKTSRPAKDTIWLRRVDSSRFVASAMILSD